MKLVAGFEPTTTSSRAVATSALVKTKLRRYLEKSGATVASENSVMLAGRVVGADLARNVVKDPA